MDLEEGDKVALEIGHKTALGYVVLIEDEHEGLLFRSDIFIDIEEGMQIDGYIKKIREDGKYDISLRPQGFRQVIDNDVDTVLHHLEKNNGALSLTDKSSPASIKFHLQMSKKAFKRAIGNLYREKKITFTENGIELISNDDQ